MSDAMRQLRVDKLTLNFGAGKEQAQLDKGVKLIKAITGINPVRTYTNKRIPGWGLRPGLPVGCRLTLRGKKAEEVLIRLLQSRENKLPHSSVDDNGNISFGIPEYPEIPGVKYDPALGIIGLQVSVTLRRPGYRVQRRKLRQAKIGSHHRISRKDAEEFMRQAFKLEFVQ